MKTIYKCDNVESDYLEVLQRPGQIKLEMVNGVDENWIFLSEKDAKKLAKTINKMLRKTNGQEEE
ncbi:hypothetical protein BK764_00210 [Bacillus thuringiensis serovar israelensis]|uniref:Uncharacterized protein n=2 Tax=Bacillus thuringiensis TaxID=1428 RepID=A0A242WF43_BACTU|nr:MULTISPECIES: hypothetical protein [Bacillus cereus group]MEB9670978.1 hypothetical protein [Bacillus anthracis]OTW44009.1 hypothetical protein BK699_33470 [Bacillus thuringiensis serovar mexicanensis]OTW54546.1 hypothetical protein BK699_03065 [Bacillus thuringiensis serovar mexicanensis]OTW55042.1 hypothetical protein BK699_02150 [Bacillus thuringiensis serovar mexicanensis]OTW73617.1 hypothetical protein BK707_02035 [Bacillus thuringiensis serovar coreanensis]